MNAAFFSSKEVKGFSSKDWRCSQPLLHEVLLLVVVICDLGRGVASELKETIMILRDSHSYLK